MLLKKLLICHLLLLPFLGYTQQNSIVSYTLKGQSDVKVGYAVLNNHSHRDTVKISNGVFLFKGKINQPTIALIQVLSQAGGGLPAECILEQGTVIVKFDNGRCQVGGTPNNISYQLIKDKTADLKQQIAVLQQKPAVGIQLHQQQKEIDSLSLKRTVLTASLVKKYQNFGAFAALGSTFRKESPSNLSFYLDRFQSFSDEPLYGYIKSHYKTMVRTETGFPVPDFVLPDLKGQMVSLSSFKGKYVLLDFWFHNCDFCRRMVPSLKKMYAEFAGKGFEILSISVDTQGEEDDWRKAVAEDAEPWPQLWDYDKKNPPILGINGYPHLFLLDKEGKLLDQIRGFQDEQTLRATLTKYLL